MFGTVIRRSIIAEKATTALVPVPVFAKKGIVTQDYRAAVAELVCEMEG